MQYAGDMFAEPIEMPKDPFFNEAREQSQVKSEIIAKYFWAWAKILAAKGGSDKIAYIDLFAGTGRYEDQTKSTPLLILEQAVQNPVMCKKLVTLFNDGNPDHSKSLRKEIDSIPGIANLRHQPEVMNEVVGESIVKQLEGMKLVPTLCFVDPFGYKGLSLRLVNSVVKDFACECLFFFNYNRINMGLNNPNVKEHMDALFSAERAEALRGRLMGLNPDDRETAIIEELTKALKEMGGRYVLPFRFRNALGSRTSHHLIFVSKHPLGYTIMKGVMAGGSSKSNQGVPSFEYSPADSRFPTLFELVRPLDQLEQMLLDHFAGRQLTMKEVFDEHNIGRPFIQPNYKDALKSLEAKGKIGAKPPAAARRKNTFADQVVVTFPKVA
jgi:three-Cys-motif partner protein